MPRAAEGREISKRLDTREEEIGAAPHRGECRKAGDCFADWAFGDFEFERTVVITYDRVALVAEVVKIPVVHPGVLCEFDIAE